MKGTLKKGVVIIGYTHNQRTSVGYFILKVVYKFAKMRLTSVKAKNTARVFMTKMDMCNNYVINHTRVSNGVLLYVNPRHS